MASTPSVQPSVVFWRTRKGDSLMRLKLCLGAVIAVLLLATMSSANVTILNEPLASSTTGTQVGGSFTGSGYQTGGSGDGIYWHLDHVVRNGYVQFTVSGLDGSSGNTKREIFHMYDADNGGAGNADTVQTSYDGNPYKVYLRRDSGTNNEWACLQLPGAGNFNDAESGALSWAGTHTIKVSWTQSGTTDFQLYVYFDGVQVDHKYPGQSSAGTSGGTGLYIGGYWNPSTMSIRIGGSPRAGGIIGATYSNLQVVDADMVPVQDDAQLISQTIPASLIAGQTQSVSVTLKNIGAATWTSAGGYHLGAMGGSDPFCAFTAVDLAGGDSIAPNQQKTFTFNMTAPSTPGAYTTDWQMIHGATWFGNTVVQQVAVQSPSQTQTLNIKPAGAITIDGNSIDWSLSDFTTTARAGQGGSGDIALTGFDSGTLYYGAYAGVLPTSAADHTARVYSRHDSSYLYFLVRCDDSDIQYGNPVNSNWANDCVEFYIDPSHAGGSTAINNSTSDVQLVIDANNQANVYMCTPAYTTQVLAGVTSAVVRDSTGWWLEARLAKSALAPAIPANGTIGLDFNFRDNDNGNDSALTTVYTWNERSSSGFPSKIPDHWGNASLATLVILPDDALYVSDTIPTSMQPGVQYNVNVVMNNSGTNTWTQAGGYQLGAIGGSDPFYSSSAVALGGADSIAQNQQKTFAFTMTAPITGGTYTTDWQMVRNGSWFGPSITKTVQVVYPDSAQFVSDTIPAAMTTGIQYNVSVTMKNTSQNTWTQALLYKLGAVDDSDPMGPGRVDMGSSDSIGPNQNKTFDFTMTAPAIPGTYTTDWRMVHELVNWFGDIDTRQVVVSAPVGEVGVVLYDPLQGSTIGTRNGGAFANGGWQCTDPTHGNDYIFWHLPRPVTHGKAEFYVKGIDPASPEKNEHFHMYDYTWYNSDYSYAPGYRDNPYKMYWRKSGTDDPYGRNNSLEIVYAILGNVIETDSSVLAWNSSTNYRITVEWGPDGNGNSVIKISRDGTQFFSQGIVGIFNPVGHAVRLGAARNSGEGSQPGAVYSYLKIWDMSETVVPPAPSVILPGNTQTITSRSPVIRWHGDPHTMYQVRVNTSNDPNIGVVWDSGQTSSTASQVTCGATLADQTTFYPFVRIGTGTGWSAWSATGCSFKVDTGYVRPRHGRVTVNGYCFQDDGGKYLALGFTHMRALNRARYDRDRYMHDMADMGSKGFVYQRILSMVSWAGLEIIPIDATNNTGATVYAWPDYDQNLKDAIDLAYDNYGIRTEITIFADAQYCCPGDHSTARYAHLDRILNDIAGREQKIQGLEVANEWYQNGISLQECKDFANYLSARTTIPVALSDDGGNMCEMYCGSGADYATVHASRDTGNYGWTPVSDVWNYTSLYPSIPPVSSGEPIGPGSSVAEENDPCRLMSAAAFAFIAHVPAYTYHGRFGVTGLDKNTLQDIKMSSTPGFGAYQYLVKLLPNDISCWTRNDGKEASAPFTATCKGLANTYWTDTAGATDGCYMNIGAANGTADGSQFVCYPMGILNGGLTLTARRQLWFKVYNPLTNAVVMDTTVKTTGQTISLPGTSAANIAYLIKGGFGPPPGTMGPVTNFVVTANGTTNNLSWTNPSDLSYSRTIVKFKTDGYPSDWNDGTLACSKTANPGSNDSFAHTGVNPGVCYYYSAWGNDGGTVYSGSAALATSCPSPDWVIDTFDNDNNGNLGNQGGWATVGATSAQVQAIVAKGGTGKAALIDTVPMAQAIANQISFSDKTTGAFQFSFDVAQDATGTAGEEIGYVSVYGTASAEITKVHIQKSRMFVEYGPGTLATLSASVTNLAWNNVKIVFNVDSKTMDFYYNGTSIGTGYAWKGTATDVTKIIFASDRNGNLNPQKAYVDNVRVEPRPGQVASVTDDGAWSPSAQKLHFTFPAVAGTPEYQYAIGTSSGGTQTRGWTSCGTSTDVIATGLSLTENTTSYYVSVQCLNQFGGAGLARNSNGIKVGVGLAKVKDAKALADGSATQVKALRGMLVSVPFSGFFYIQEPGAPFGIKVLSNASVSSGDLIDVCGVMKGTGAERYLDATSGSIIKTTPAPGGPYPVLLGSNSIGGSTLNSNTPGIVGGFGPNNIGLYTVACGKVTQRQTTAPAYFYIDDGNGLSDGTSTGGVANVGIRVSADPTSYPTGSYVSVTGIVSCFTSSGLRPQILPQTIQTLKAP